MTDHFRYSEEAANQSNGLWVELNPDLKKSLSGKIRKLAPMVEVQDTLALRGTLSTHWQRFGLMNTQVQKASQDPILPTAILGDKLVIPFGYTVQQREEFPGMLLVFFGITGLSPDFYTQHREHFLYGINQTFRSHGLSPFPSLPLGKKPMI